MWKYTVQIDGMMCGMCEAHMNDAVRKNFPVVKKVTSSHGKGRTVILSEGELNEQELKDTVTATGYEMKGINKEPYKKKGLFSFF